MSIVESETKFEVSSYRWVVLLFFMLMAIMTQIVWITFAPITDESASYFSIGGGNIGSIHILFLSMVFMIVYLPVNYFSIKGIEKYGLKWGTGIGVILTGVFAILRAVVPNYWAVLAFQIGCAVGQPFVLNSFTKLAINWFPEKEKALAASLGTMGVLLGVALGMFLPVIFMDAGTGIGTLLYIYGGATLLCMVLYLIFVKDKPDSPPNAYSEKPMELGIRGTRDLFRKDFLLLFILVLLGAGVFNALSTGIDLLFANMTHDYGLGEDAIGILGGVMIVGGIGGAVILSTLSDKFRKRKIFLILAVGTSTVFAILFYFIKDFRALLVIAFFFGFMLISALPIGFTFATEMTYPVPEETSNGWLMWSGQFSGILLIALVMFIPPAAIQYNFIIYAVLFAIATVLAFFLKDLKDYELKKE